MRGTGATVLALHRCRGQGASGGGVGRAFLNDPQGGCNLNAQKKTVGKRLLADPPPVLSTPSKIFHERATGGLPASCEAELHPLRVEGVISLEKAPGGVRSGTGYGGGRTIGSAVLVEYIGSLR